MRTYTAANLTTITKQSQYDAATAAERLRWARNWTRFLLRDIPNEAGAFPANGIEDEELDAVLALNSVEQGGIAYYLPHVVAARILEADPTRWLTISMSGYSETRRDPQAIAAQIRTAYGPLIEAVLPEAIRPQAGQFAITF